MEEEKNLIQKATQLSLFPTLLDAAKKLGLTDRFSGDKKYTIFAPLEKAFEAIPDEVIDEAFDDPDYLLGIVNYHIVEGSYHARDFKDMDRLRTLNGEDLIFTSKEGLKVNGIKIEIEDIECSNGMIHAIPDILLP